MNSLEINKILSKNKTTNKYFLGCFASDKIPDSNVYGKYPHCMVINTDNSFGNGEHWVAIYVKTQKYCEYYDSLGDWPSPYRSIRQFLLKFSDVKHNVKQLQSARSSSCGKHVIYFLHMRCKGSPFNKIIQRLTQSKTRPDVLVSNFLHKLLNYN